MSVNCKATSLAVRQLHRSPVMSKTTVCRRLFGEVDHGELKRVLEESKAVMFKQQAEKWNFDYETETPMRGRYDWQRVMRGDENVPKAYALDGMTPTTTVSRATVTDAQCVAACESECSQDNQQTSDRCKTQRKSSHSTQRHIPGKPSVYAIKMTMLCVVIVRRCCDCSATSTRT